MNTTEVFAERLRNLRNDNEISLKELAGSLGTTAQSLSLYERAERTMNIDLLVKVSEYFKVSTDYLLGLAENTTTDPNLKAFCDYTGLSEQAIKKLNEIDNFVLRFCKFDDKDYSSKRNRLLLVLNEAIENEFLLFFSFSVAELFRLSAEWATKSSMIIHRDGKNANRDDELIAELDANCDLLHFSINKNVEEYLEDNDCRYCIEYNSPVHPFDILKKKILEEAKGNGKHNPPKE